MGGSPFPFPAGTFFTTPVTPAGWALTSASRTNLVFYSLSGFGVFGAVLFGFEITIPNTGGPPSGLQGFDLSMNAAVPDLGSILLLSSALGVLGLVRFSRKPGAKS